jgi:hypothetical protein
MAQQLINIGTENAGDGDNLRAAFDKTNDNFNELYFKKYGFFDYNDLATSTAPISVVGGGGFTYLTNDGLGSFTNKSYPPTNVTDVWDAANDRFDFSELNLGAEVRYRIDLELITSSANQEVDLELELAIGGSSYSLSVAQRYYKTAGTYPLVVYNSLYMGDSNTMGNYAKFKIQSGNNVDVKVNGWATFIHLY